MQTKMNNLDIKDREIFKAYLGLRRHELAAYAFENIYIWKRLFDIRWTIYSGSLLVFFRDNLGTFLYLPPLSATEDEKAVKEAFRIMDGLNPKALHVSRIENVEERDTGFYHGQGYKIYDKPADYLCRKSALIDLKGKAFKSKRASINYFSKHFRFKYLPYAEKFKDDCLGLYRLWARQRKEKTKDRVYQGMLDDSLVCLGVLLEDYRHLAASGRVVTIDQKLKGFTFGYRLNRDTFCVLYEITDLSIKGLAQFIFRRFCAEQSQSRYINIMDDSQLENLRRVKESYRPERRVPAFIVSRKDG